MAPASASLALASLGWCARELAPETTTDDLIRRLSVLDTEALAPVSQLALREAGQELLEAVANTDDDSAQDWLAQVGRALPDKQSLQRLDALLGGLPEEWRSLLDAEDGEERSIVVAARLIVWLRQVAPEAIEPHSLERLLAFGWAAPGCTEITVNFYKAYCLALHDRVLRAVKVLDPVLLGARLEAKEWYDWLGREAGLPPIQDDETRRISLGSPTIAAVAAVAIAGIWWLASRPEKPRPKTVQPTVVEPSAAATPTVTLASTPIPNEAAEPATTPRPDPLTQARLLITKAKKSLAAGQEEEADSDARSAQDLLEDLPPVRDVNVAEALKELAEHWEARGRWTDAGRVLQKAVRSYEGTPAENAGPQLDAVNRWAGALRKTGRLTEAEKLYRTLLQAYEGTGPALEVDAATVAHNLANALVDSGRFADARGFYERALSMLANHWATEDEAHRLAGIMGKNYQHCLAELGFPDEQALAQTRKLLKLPPPTTGR
jgi:tetratricopeptide (TPR) repeat protein